MALSEWADVRGDNLNSKEFNTLKSRGIGGLWKQLFEGRSRPSHGPGERSQVSESCFYIKRLADGKVRAAARPEQAAGVDLSAALTPGSDSSAAHFTVG